MPHAMLGVPTDLASPEIVAIIGADEAARAAALDAAPVGAVADDVTLGALVRARMGDVVADRILTPVVAGVHAADPDLVEASAVIPGLVGALAETGSLSAAAARLRSASGVPGSAIVGLRGGMTTLVRALEDDVRARGASIRVGAQVTSITPDGDAWRVDLDGEALAADAVVLGVDAPTSARLLAAVPSVADALAGIAVGDVAVVAAVLDAPALDDDPVGSGLLVAPGHPRVRAKALTHATAKWAWIREAYGPGRHLVRLSYGRDGRIDESLDDLPAIVRGDIAEIFGIEAPTLIDVRVVRWDRSLVFPRPGHRAAVRRVHAAAADQPGLAIVGAGIGGNGLAGTIALARTAPRQLTSPATTSMGD
jgi:oxygen-dependent protoporphyrinogen oxidase